MTATDDEAAVLEVVRAAQSNEVAAVAMAATDEAWLPLNVRYGVADRLWELGYRKVSDEARTRGHEWMRTVTERVNRGEVAEVIDAAEAVISLLLGVAQPVTRDQIIAFFAEAEPVTVTSARRVEIAPSAAERHPFLTADQAAHLESIEARHLAAIADDAEQGPAHPDPADLADDDLPGMWSRSDFL